MQRVGWMLENVSDTLSNHFERLLHCSNRLLLRRQIRAHFFIASSWLSRGTWQRASGWRWDNECVFNRKQFINIREREMMMRCVSLHKSSFVSSCLIKRHFCTINPKRVFLTSVRKFSQFLVRTHRVEVINWLHNRSARICWWLKGDERFTCVGTTNPSKGKDFHAHFDSSSVSGNKTQQNAINHFMILHKSVFV